MTLEGRVRCLCGDLGGSARWIRRARSANRGWHVTTDISTRTTELSACENTYFEFSDDDDDDQLKLMFSSSSSGVKPATNTSSGVIGSTSACGCSAIAIFSLPLPFPVGPR